jgi:hypothetical protein
MFKPSAPGGPENRSRFQQQLSGLDGAGDSEIELRARRHWPSRSSDRDTSGWFGKWLESLRNTMANLPAGFPEAATKEPGGHPQLVSGRFARNTSRYRVIRPIRRSRAGCCIQGPHLA